VTLPKEGGEGMATDRLPRSPHDAGRLVRAITTPFILGLAVSTLAWAVYGWGISDEFLDLHGLAWASLVVMIGMPTAGFVIRAMCASHAAWLGLVAAAVGATVPIVWVVAHDASWALDPMTSTLNFSVPAWLALALGYGAHWLLSTQWTPGDDEANVPR
jgi:hypothetical protein